MSNSCEIKYVVTAENTILKNISDVPLDTSKYLGGIDGNYDYHHLQQGISDAIFVRSGRVEKVDGIDKVICIDNHLHKERDIGRLVEYSILKSYVYFARHYLDLKERLESLFGINETKEEIDGSINKPRIISLDLLTLHIGGLNTHKGLGDYQFLYESLDKKYKEMTLHQSK